MENNMETPDINTLLSFYGSIRDLIAKEVEIALKSQPRETFQSPSIDLLAEALSVAQGAYPELVCSKVNVFTKTEYADLAAIYKAVRKPLADNHLSVTQIIDVKETGEIMIHTKLLHNSGQYIESRARVIAIAGDQKATDSAITFAKRQALMSILGIASAQDYSDDDGVSAMEKGRITFEKGTALNKDYKPQDGTETISKDQIAELDYELQEYPDICKDLFSSLRIESLSDIPKDMYRDVISRVRRIKLLRSQS